jgi:hypothetical protein
MSDCRDFETPEFEAHMISTANNIKVTVTGLYCELAHLLWGDSSTVCEHVYIITVLAHFNFGPAPSTKIINMIRSHKVC